MIQKDIDALEKEKSNDIRKCNTFNIFNNVMSTFTTDTYLHPKNMSKETMFERSITERIKLRRERTNESKRKEENVNNKLFKKYFTDYQSSSGMYKKLSKTKNAEINKTQVDSIKKVLSRLQIIIDYVSKYNTFKVEEDEKIIDIVEKIFYFNQLNQAGNDLKRLTPHQMLSRLPISLAQLKVGNDSEKKKIKNGNLRILCTDPKTYKNIYKSLDDII